MKNYILIRSLLIILLSWIPYHTFGQEVDSDNYLWVRVERLSEVDRALGKLDCTKDCRIRGINVSQAVPEGLEKLGEYIIQRFILYADDLKRNLLSDLTFLRNYPFGHSIDINEVIELERQLKRTIIPLMDVDGVLEDLHAFRVQFQDVLDENPRIIDELKQADDKIEARLMRFQAFSNNLDEFIGGSMARGYTVKAVYPNSGKRFLKITRIAGGAFLGVALEFLFADRLEAATLSQYDLELESNDFNAFTGAVNMEIEGHLTTLAQYGQTPEDRQRALQMLEDIKIQRANRALIEGLRESVLKAIENVESR